METLIHTFTGLIVGTKPVAKLLPCLHILLRGKLDEFVNSPVTITTTSEHEKYVKKLLITTYGFLEIGNTADPFGNICRLINVGGKQTLDVIETYKNLGKLNLSEGYYLIHNPFCRESYVPPPDILLFRISATKKTIEHVGVECKSSKTHSPTFNDTFPKTYDESRIIYFFTSVGASRRRSLIRY